MNAHEYAKLFPLASENEIAGMAKDIKERGLVNPIVTYQGKILDGRNRFAACKVAGVEPAFVKYTGTDALGDVISWNMHRRHLSTSQRSAVSANIEVAFAKQARERMRTSTGGSDPRPVANLPPPGIVQKAREQAAALMNVSPRQVQSAKHVKNQAPELFEKVKEGKMSINAAVEQIAERNRSKPVMTKAQAAACRPCLGMKFAKIAIINLGEIATNDMQRQEAFAAVKGWIDEHQDA
jgi:ParB-like chromosome segregation protein Spo0J